MFLHSLLKKNRITSLLAGRSLKPRRFITESDQLAWLMLNEIIVVCVVIIRWLLLSVELRATCFCMMLPLLWKHSSLFLRIQHDCSGGAVFRLLWCLVTFLLQEREILCSLKAGITACHQCHAMHLETHRNARAE